MNVANLDSYQSKWLKGEDLNGRTYTVTIEHVALEMIRQADGTSEQKLVVAFANRNKMLICNKTQFNALRSMFGDESNDWLNRQVMLSPAVSQNGKPTIQLLPVAAEDAEDEIPF